MGHDVRTGGGDDHLVGGRRVTGAIVDDGDAEFTSVSHVPPLRRRLDRVSRNVCQEKLRTYRAHVERGRDVDHASTATSDADVTASVGRRLLLRSAAEHLLLEPERWLGLRSDPR